MQWITKWVLLVLICGWPGIAAAQLQLLPDRELQSVFAGNDKKIQLLWHNAGEKKAMAEIYARLYQTSSATAVLLSVKPWKTIEILPGQTVLGFASIDFPDVRMQTKFLVQWLENTNRIIGATEVQVYPTNLLAELKPLAEDESLGVLDPSGQLKPLLKNAGVDFVDLGASELEHFPGKLAIIGPFTSKAQLSEGLIGRIGTLAKKGVAVVWIVPADLDKELKPSFYLVPKGSGIVVVAQTGLVSNLATNPKSQLNLIYFCQLALRPKPWALPELSPHL